MSWIDFWSASEHDHVFWRKSIEYYFENLRRLIELKSDFSVLDFGAGPGYLGELLGPCVQHVDLIEPSAELRAIARNITDQTSNVIISDYSMHGDLSSLMNERKYDLIIINSVLQYMGTIEIDTLLKTIQTSLKKDGALIVSDIVPEGSLLLRELGSVFQFYLKWFGLKAFLMHLLNEFRLSPKRARYKLTTFTKKTFEDSAEAYFCVQWVKNPTICANRYAAILRLKNEPIPGNQ